MSQTNSDSSRRSRRIRAGHKRPTLVTQENRNEQITDYGDEQASAQPTSSVAVEELTPPTAKTRRSNGFFANIGKKKDEEQDNSSEVAKARLARATRGKVIKNTEAETSKKDTTPEKTAVSVGSAGAKATQKPGGFKARHILGMALYLVLSNLVGYAETAVMSTMGWDVKITEFNLFGNQVVVKSSTIIFLATLILILVILARFDLLPTRMSSAPPARKKASEGSSIAVKREPVTIKQGEKGPDDQLYQSFRQNQRREKKR